MSVLKADMTHLQSLIGDAFSKTGALVALADAGNPDPDKIQRNLETIADQFERATLELRRLCECSAPGTGGYMRRPRLASLQIAGSVEMLEYTWLHIQINTLLPHCRYQTPAWKQKEQQGEQPPAVEEKSNAAQRPRPAAQMRDAEPQARRTPRQSASATAAPMEPAYDYRIETAE